MLKILIGYDMEGVLIFSIIYKLNTTDSRNERENHLKNY